MPPMVSEQEIEREYKTLRNLRRRSASSPGPGALPVDPDLPPTTASTSSSSSSPYSSNDDVILSTPDGLDADNPAGLFWVPAHLHPELAPGEFRAFLKAHTHDPDAVDEAVDTPSPGGIRRSGSLLGRSNRNSVDVGAADGGLNRKRSMLSRQYHPKAGDKVEEEAPPVPALSRSNSQRASIYGGRSGEKGLTLEDLQKLEMLADEAALSEDPESMRRLLRRSLSMNVAPGYSDDQVSLTDEADEPIIVPRPGSILRRSARTKIRKASLAGDGGGHRFAATRKGRMTAAPMHELWQEDADEDREGGERRRSDDSEEMGSGESQSRTKTPSSGDYHDHDDDERYYDAPQHIEERRSSDVSTEESNIFDAYARNPSRSSSVSSSSVGPSESPSPDSSPPSSHLNLPSLAPIVTPTMDSREWYQHSGDKTPTQESISDPLIGYRRPSPGTEDGGEHHLAGPQTGPLGMTLQVPSDTSRYGHGPPSPTLHQNRSTSPEVELLPGMAPPQRRISVPPGIALQQKKSQESMTPVALDRPNPLTRTDSSTSAVSATSSASKEREKEKEKEKKGGFFSKKDKKDKDKDEKKEVKKKDKDKFLGSLFGSKKKSEEPAPMASFSSAAGSAAAAALLGSSKSAKSLGHGPPSPALSSPGLSPYARYPIHVERAVYRLSHIKLANARRPLYEQVLISNLMFWYLGVIGKGNSATEEKKHGQPNGLDDKKEEAKPVIKGTPPTPVASGSAARPGYVAPEPVVIKEKKTSLTKPERSRGSSNAEAGVRPPQYGAQGAQMDKELRHASSNGSMQNQPVPPSQQMQRPVSQPHLSTQQLQQQQQQQQLAPLMVSQQRAMSSPSPNRALSPTSPQGRAAPEGYPQQPTPLVHRELQGPPRGVPHSSFGPPPAQRPPMDEPMRQRTLSQPSQPQPGMLPPSGGMRRVVTEGQPPQMYPQQGMVRRENPQPQPGQQYPPPRPQGLQPGQVFQYPNGQHGQQPQFRPPPSPGAQPGQIFHPPQNHQHPPQQHGKPGLQPGQVFQHPQYRPLPPPGQNPGHLLPPGGPGRLPPGAGSGPPGPGWIPGSPPPAPLPPGQAYNGGVPPQQLRRTMSPPGGIYDPRHRPPPQQLGYPNGGGALSPPPAGFYQRPPAGSPVPGQIFGGYPPGVAPPLNQGREGYGRQPQPAQGPYVQHR